MSGPSTIGRAFLHDSTGAPITNANPLPVSATVNASVNGFQPNGNYATLAVSGATANALLPAGATVVVYNTAAVTAFVNLGVDNTVTATTTQIPVSAGGAIGLTVGANTWIAGITGSGAGTLILVAGTGLFSGFSGSAAAGTTNTNLTQIAGTAVDANSGNKGAGTQRVVLATDQPALTTPMPVSGTVTANLGTIAGVSTAAKQPALGVAGTASADVITVQGIASMTALKVDGSGVTQPVSIAALPALPANQSTNVAQVGGNAVVTGGTNGSLGVGGLAADSAAVVGNPLYTGARAQSTARTSAADGQVVAIAADLKGHPIVVLNAPRNLKGTQAISFNSAAAQTLIPAGGVGIFNDIEALIITNTSATTVEVDITDGTNVRAFEVPTTDTRGITVATMLKAASSNVAWQVTSASAVANIKVAVEYAIRQADG